MPKMHAGTAKIMGLALVLVFPGAAFAQVAPLNRNQTASEKQSLTDWKSGVVLGDIQGTANYHSIVVPREKIRDAASIDSIKADSGFLHSRWLADGGKSQIPQAYIDQLKGDQELLNRASNPDISADQKTRILNDVADDLSIKSSHSKASPSEWAALVHVDINTLRNGSVVGNHEIWYAAKGWADVPSRWIRCANLSSPAKADLPPGAYVMRADNGANVPLKIGGDGKDQQTVELRVQ
jgi:hypothetical protein